MQVAEQVDTNKYAFEIENGLKVSHIAIFLLPGVELDPSFKALVYFQLPNQEFKLFGSVSSSKPSAIFKLNNTVSSTPLISDDMELDSANPLENITVGISIEPVQEADTQLGMLKSQSLQAQPKMITTGQDTNATALLAGKIVKHAYNYLTGFVDTQGNVSIKYFDSWWDKFKTKLNNDPKFLEQQE